MHQPTLLLLQIQKDQLPLMRSQTSQRCVTGGTHAEHHRPHRRRQKTEHRKRDEEARTAAERSVPTPSAIGMMVSSFCASRLGPSLHPFNHRLVVAEITETPLPGIQLPKDQLFFGAFERQLDRTPPCGRPTIGICRHIRLTQMAPRSHFQTSCLAATTATPCSDPRYTSHTSQSENSTLKAEAAVQTQ